MKRRLAFYGSLVLALVLCGVYMTAMPGTRHEGPLPQASSEMKALATALEGHVVALSSAIGERRIGHGDSLERARDYVAGVAGGVALHGGWSLRFEKVGEEGAHADNLIMELRGASPALIVVGAHYDTAVGSPGADDNASGVAATLELARRFDRQRFEKTVRFVLFANEEPPYFQNPGMGSLVHARGCKERNERVDAMLSLESVGYFSDAPGSQRYPWPVGLLYPDRGDFIGFVGNLGSRSLVREAIGTFRGAVQFPSEGSALPAGIPGVGWSDHWAFWELGYPAIMVTGTALFRDPHYHRGSDVAANLDYLRLARVTLGLEQVIRHLAR